MIVLDEYEVDWQIPEEDREHVNARLLKEYDCYPVYLSDDLADRHYNGKCCAHPRGISMYT